MNKNKGRNIRRSCQICKLYSARGCNEDVRMSGFPVNIQRCKMWVKMVGKENLTSLPIAKLKHLCICENHFNISDFKEKRLKKTAVPSKNLCHPPLDDAILQNFPVPLKKETDEFDDALLTVHHDHNYVTSPVSESGHIMDSAGDWCLIESDPGVFTQLIRKFGVNGVQVEELWTIEDAIFENLRPVHGLIFLFKYIQHEEPSAPVVTDSRLDRIYFAKQVINNACATQAVISILLNCNHPDVDLGPELTKLKEFSMSFDPKMRGLTLSNSQTIRSAHNSMSQQAVFEVDPKAPTKDDDAYHFVGYMPIDGRLYELDGLKEGPIDHGPIAPEQDWLDVVRPIIMKRINVYTEGEIHFNLLAVVSDRKMIYERQLEEVLSTSSMMGMETDAFESEVPRLRMLIDYEDVKMARYRQEMARRKHNYLPFIVVLLKILAEEKKLMPLFEKAKERAAKRGPKKMKV